MTTMDTSEVLARLTMRIESRTGGTWVQSPWPGDLYHDDGAGQVTPYSGHRFSLIPTMTEPMTAADGVHHRARRGARAVVSSVDVRWSATTPIDDGAGPFHAVLTAERELIEAATEHDGEPMRVLWLRATRAVQDSGWVVGTASLQIHHEIEMR